MLAGMATAWAADEQTLARYVPADVGLFVELREGEDLLVPLLEPQLWATLARIAGQPARPEDASEWEKRIRETVNLAPADAIRTLFARRVAFAGAGLGRSQDAVVLCQPTRRPRDLIRGWPAQPLPASTRSSLYRLPYRVGLACSDRLLVFGDAGPSGMFSRVLSVLEADEPATLADDPAFKRLLARVPAAPDGVFYVRLGPGRAIAAPLELPGPLRESGTLLLALHRKGQLLHFTAVGDAPQTPVERTGMLHDLVAGLPERTLIAWAGHVDYPALVRASALLPEDDILRVALQLAPLESLQRLTTALDSATCLALGVVAPDEPGSGAPPVPAFALLIRARERDTVSAEWGTLLQSTLAIYRLLSFRGGGAERTLRLEPLLLEDAAGEQLDLGALLGPGVAGSLLGRVQLAWVMDDNVLILASHAEWLRQILAARHARGPRLAGVLDLARGMPTTKLDNLFLAQTGPIADLGQQWLRFFEQTMPAVLEPDWWRAYQPAGRSPRLGVQVTADPERRRLMVYSVLPGTPAHGVLRPGDEIIGCNRRRFATTQPVQEVQQGLVQRPDARFFELYIERDHVVSLQRIPLPFVDPVQMLRRVVAVGQVVQRIVYADGVPDPLGPRGGLTLELRPDDKPLFVFTPLEAVTPPAVLSETAPPAHSEATNGPSD